MLQLLSSLLALLLLLRVRLRKELGKSKLRSLQGERVQPLNAQARGIYVEPALVTKRGIGLGAKPAGASAGHEHRKSHTRSESQCARRLAATRARLPKFPRLARNGAEWRRLLGETVRSVITRKNHERDEFPEARSGRVPLFGRTLRLHSNGVGNAT